MSNIGKKVRIINNYGGSTYNGQIGTIISEEKLGSGGTYFQVTLGESGLLIQPNNPNNPTGAKQCEFVDEKLLGYVLKPEFHSMENAVKIITGFDAFNFKKDPRHVQIDVSVNPTGTVCHRKLKAAGVLDLWFQPVFKEEKKEEFPYKVGDIIYYNYSGAEKSGGRLHKITDITEKVIISDGIEAPTSLASVKDLMLSGCCGHVIRLATPEEVASFGTKTLTVGHNNSLVTIKQGQITARNGSDVFSLESLKGLYNLYISAKGFNLGAYPSNPDPQVRFIQVGCKQEGPLISLIELKSIINAAS